MSPLYFHLFDVASVWHKQVMININGAQSSMLKVLLGYGVSSVHP